MTFWVPAVCAAGFECLGRYGEGGKTTGELLAAGYMTQLVSSGATDVIVGPGFNDMAGVIDPSVFQANYNTLIKTIMANGMTPHLVSIQDDYNNGFPGRAIEYNMAIYLLARKYDLQYNDIFIGLQNPDGSFKTGMSVGDNVHMSAAAAAVSSSRYAARLIDGASDVPLARCKGNTAGAAQKIGLIANQIMDDSDANGEADGWVYGATSTSKSVVATTDGYKSVFTVTATSTAGVAVLLYRNSSLNAAKAYKIALTLRIKIGEMVGANSGQYIATSFQIMSNASGTITGKAQLLSAPGTFDIFCEMNVPAGSNRHDYSILMRGSAAAVNVASVIEVSNMDAIDITDLIY